MASSTNMDRDKHVIHLEVCHPFDEKHNKHRQTKLKEIAKAVNGLLNSGGGRLVLHCLFKKMKEVRKEVDRMCGRVESVIINFLTLALYTSHVEIDKQSLDIIVLNVVGLSSTHGLQTLNYNMYLPTSQQVLPVPPSEHVQFVKEIMKGRPSIEEPTLLGSHAKHFVKGQSACLVESKSTIIMGLFKQKKMSRGSLRFVSALANCVGGHIYYGINEIGIVEGQVIKQPAQAEIIKSLRKTIDNMVWPKHCGQSKKMRGKQWEIHFEPVKDCEGHTVPSLFVVVIYVAQCLGGVFTKEPECYHIVNGQVTKFNFPEWRLKIQNYVTKEAYKEMRSDSKESEDDEKDIQGAKLGYNINKYGSLNDDTSLLKSIKWVENYKTCVVITCQDGTTPSMADLKRVVPKEVLPYIEFTKSKEWKPLQEKYKEKKSDSEESEDDEEDIQETDDEEKSNSQQYEKTGSSEEDGQNILSKLSWFEETLLNDDFELEDEQENFLASLPWVRNFYIGLSEKDNSLQLFITCEKDEVPRMAELKKEFGEDIVYFVEFIPGTDAVFEYLVNGNNSSTTKPHHMGGPMSGDAIYNVNDSPKNYGSLCIFVADGEERHFATTCYHVCYCDEKLPDNLRERHQQLIKDSNNTESLTHEARHCYRCRREEKGNEENQDEDKRNYNRLEQESEGNSSSFGEDDVDCHSVHEGGRPEEINVLGRNGENESGRVRERKEEEEQMGKGEEKEEKGKSRARNENKERVLGTFFWGVYNERHDISLIKLPPNLNCSCTMSGITCSELPEKKDIADIFKKYDGELKVEKTGFSTETTEGIFVGLGFCELKKRGRDIRKGYLIKNKDDSRPFSEQGDSGALVKLVPPNNEKIPFAYIVNSATTGETFCFNLRSSLNKCKCFKEGRMKACLGSCARIDPTS